MDWKDRLVMKLFRLWRFFKKPRGPCLKKPYEERFQLEHVNVWRLGKHLSVKDMEIYFPSGLPNDIRTSSDTFIEYRYKFRDVYYRLITYANRKMYFPPFQSESQTPSFRIFERDYAKIDCVLQISETSTIIDNSSSNEQEQEKSHTLSNDYHSIERNNSYSVESKDDSRNDDNEIVQDREDDYEYEEDLLDISEPNMDALLKELRGPGKELFHQDVSEAVSWEDLKRWISAYYLVYLEMEEEDRKYLEKSSVSSIITIHWTDSSKETICTYA